MRLFVPGRICLFGEHSDWAGAYRELNPELEKGYTLICGTDQGVYADVRPHPDALVLTSTRPNGESPGPHEIPMKPQALLAEARGKGYWSYIAGVSYQAVTRFGVRGLVIDNDKTDLPIKKGLASSAAICVLTARAFNRLYELNLTTREEMELAYQGEITTLSRCGRMDQGCAFGKHPVLMIFDGDRLETRELGIREDLHLVIVDLQARKDTVRILSELNGCFPVADNEIQKGVQKLLGPINRSIVRRAEEALRESDAPRLGEIMTEAQRLFDRYAIPASPEELEAPALHRLLKFDPLKPHVWGGKGIGSQGDGTAQLIARNAVDQKAAIEIIERQLGMKCLTLTLRASQQVSRGGR